MKFPTTQFIVITLAFLISTQVGCGKKSPWETAVVTGTVTLNGAPVTNALIEFIPNGDGPSSVGDISPEGKYELALTNGEAGAVVGTHQIQIVCMEAGSVDIDEEGVTESGGEAPPCEVPKKFEAATTSGLTADVKSGEPNVIDFALEG